ncbi:MAG TPA: zinc-dependent peptidase [Rubricoccaceae bacterium]|nr:zinc-dependent peptidase [Rubricoccaceae bacterium]
MYVARRSDFLFGAAAAGMAGAASTLVGGAAFGAAWVGSAVGLLVALAFARRPLRRWRAVRQAFPEAWRAWLRAHVPLYARADGEARRRFERDVQITLAEQRFEAAAGAEVTDDLKLAVAAGAAVLLHGRPDWDLPTGRTILFLPGRFDDSYDFDEDASFDGMVHPQGPVLFSIPAVEASWENRDGYNVVLHELAHLFDFAAHGADGLPSLADPASADAWMALVREEMRKARMGKSLLSSYAATAPAELFAVAVEQFFERPVRMHKHHPALFEALVAFFQLDPRRYDGENEAFAPRESLMARRWVAPEEPAEGGA